MNKKMLSFALMLILTFTGCTTENNRSETSENTTALTTAITTEAFQDLPEIDDSNFDNYDNFLAEYTKDRSTKYVYPLPDIVNTWELESITLSQSNYTLYYNDTTNAVSVMLEISYNSTYSTISQYFDGIAFSMGVENIEMYDRYSVQHYTESDSYSIIGITGEENKKYTLVVSSDDETADPVALLKEYKDILEL